MERRATGEEAGVRAPSGEAVALRRATPDDAEALSRLRLDLLREIGNLADDRQAGPLLAAIRGYFAPRLASGEFVAWVVEVEGRLVASSALVFFARPPDAGNLSGMDIYVMNRYTLPAWRGRSRATALLTELPHFAQASAAGGVRLRATEEGRPIYQRAGFRQTATEMELRW